MLLSRGVDCSDFVFNFLATSQAENGKSKTRKEKKRRGKGQVREKETGQERVKKNRQEKTKKK